MCPACVGSGEQRSGVAFDHGFPNWVRTFSQAGKIAVLRTRCENTCPPRASLWMVVTVSLSASFGRRYLPRFVAPRPASGPHDCTTRLLVLVFFPLEVALVPHWQAFSDAAEAAAKEAAAKEASDRDVAAVSERAAAWNVKLPGTNSIVAPLCQPQKCVLYHSACAEAGQVLQDWGPETLRRTCC